jgi:hypothetical protein
MGDITVARLRSGFLVIVLSCGLGFASFAQESPPPGAATPSAAAPTAASKAHGAKTPRKKAGAAHLTVAPSSEEAERAARLAEGRKKFFEQSSGFENGKLDMPLSLGAGGAPAVGMKF